MDHEEEVKNLSAEKLIERVQEYVDAKAKKIELVKGSNSKWKLIATVPD